MRHPILTGLAATIFATLGFYAVAVAIPAPGDEIDVVVNKANDISDLPVAEARKFFLGDKTTWPNGKHVSVVMLAPGSAERAAILRQIYKMSEGDYSKYFLQAAFTGRVEAPPTDASSPAQVKQLVEANPGALAYMKAENVDGP